MGKYKPTKTASNTAAPSISLDGDDVVIAPGAIGSAGAPAEAPAPPKPLASELDPDYAHDAAAPTHPEFLSGPKTKPAAGDGTGGRPWVYSGGVMRREHQGDELRPRCPGCTRDDVAVLCKATSSREVTHYRCECCRSFRTQKLRPAIAAQMKAGNYSPPNNKPFVERP